MVLFKKCVRRFGPLTKMVELNLTQDHLVWNQQLNQNQTLMEQSLDGPFPKLCPAVTLSHQDGRHSTVALLFKAALIQMSDYRLLGASGFFWPLCCMSFDLRPLVHSDFSKNTIKDINLYLIMTMKSCIDFDAISISNWNYIEYNDYKYSTNAEHPCQRCFFQR